MSPTRSARGTRRAALALAALAVACSDASTPRKPTGQSSTQDADAGQWYPPTIIETPNHGKEPVVNHTYAPTFTAVFDEVIAPTCGIDFCHNGDGAYMNAMTKELAYSTLVGATTDSSDCGKLGLLRVKPGSPEESLLYLKVTDPPCGGRMPLCYGCVKVLDQREVDQIAEWIRDGAQDD